MILNGIDYKVCINLFGKLQNDCYGISPGETSFIAIDSNNKYIKFGNIDEKVFFDYREDKNGKKFFQQTLNFGDYCDITNDDDNDDYYNVKYVYKCDSRLTGKPTFRYHLDKDDKCKITIDISTKEACDYTKLSYDSFLIEFKVYICIIYSICSAILLYPKINYIAFIISNSLAFNIIFSIIAFNFGINFWIIFSIQIIFFIFNIFLIILIECRVKEKKTIYFIFYLIFCIVSGFFLGEELVEIITIYIIVLQNYTRWLIIISCSICINLFLFLDLIKTNIAFVICSSLNFSYFISNIVAIAGEKKLPIDTIINSFINKGFDILYMKMFRNPKYYIYYIIYFCCFLANIMYKSIYLYFDKDEESLIDNFYKNGIN